ncbi:hypothetical protein HY486_01820 [Candidatus Woesearchaeota archaeon]|nr:hypothetical protein [Candidatus Woesearchaeota archaeon]
MSHNMTVTVEEDLWKAMKTRPEIRWSVVMKEAAKNKLNALAILDKLSSKTKQSEEEIEAFAVKLGKKITCRK